MLLGVMKVVERLTSIPSYNNNHAHHHYPVHHHHHNNYFHHLQLTWVAATLYEGNIERALPRFRSTSGWSADGGHWGPGISWRSWHPADNWWWLLEIHTKWLKALLRVKGGQVISPGLSLRDPTLPACFPLLPLGLFGSESWNIWVVLRRESCFHLQWLFIETIQTDYCGLYIKGEREKANIFADSESKWHIVT